MSAYTKDTIALGIIDQGRRDAIIDKGIIIAIATALVESDLTMYANENVPESLNFPHDAVGSDASSCGVFQQRPEWWGTVADEMDVARSSHMFYDSLRKQRIDGQDYKTDATTPGGWAQMVQRSAFPDRYDQRMDEAKGYFARLRGANTAPDPGTVQNPQPIVAPPKYREVDMITGGGCSSRSRPPINFFIHTEEGGSTAEQLAQFCDGSHDVSYHYTLRDGILCDVVDTDYYSWSVLDANVFSINLCYAGSRAGWSRDEWLQREKDIEISAFIAVQDCRKYNFANMVIPPPYHKDSGISDHKYVTQCLGIGTHTDVGDDYPWDVFTHYRDKYAGRDVGPSPGAQMGSSQSIYRQDDESIGDMESVVRQNNGMIHETRVEQLALLGDEQCLAWVKAVADGKSPVQDELPDWAAEHAKAVLAEAQKRSA